MSKKRLNFQEVMELVDQALLRSAKEPIRIGCEESLDAKNLFSAVQAAGKPYRAACGFVSRKKVDPEEERLVRERLYAVRANLDRRIECTLREMFASGQIRWDKLLRRQVFGFCKKQGVSFRLSLSTCVPTKLCGGGCYAHDGRERVTSTILSGAYNTLLCEAFESGELPAPRLLPSIKKAIELAKRDAKLAEREFGFKRRARIRLGHVGEVTAFPQFVNWLGRTITDHSEGTVDTIVYTRHPSVVELDTSIVVVNLTLDKVSQNRRRWVKPGVRVVWSAWDGELDADSEVNFLEHHDHDQHSSPSGEGPVCPVTIASTARRVCDEFRCTKCFDRVGALKSEPEAYVTLAERPKRRVRHRSHLQEVKTES
ncbi:MAG: hypothetical protein P8J33_02470 [Pirellulaceae bacterium]|nr:hypothetical protein [Pirellulaceae bacterium]